MKYKHSHVRYLREGMTLSERFFSVVMAKQVFGKVCPDWMWQRVHEAGVSDEEWEKRLMNALPTKYVLREYQYSGTMGKMYFLEPLFNEEEDTSGTFSPERFRH